VGQGQVFDRGVDPGAHRGDCVGAVLPVAGSYVMTWSPTRIEEMVGDPEASLSA